MFAPQSRLDNRLTELEAATDRPDASEYAKQLTVKLDTLVGEFKSLHFKLINLIEDNESELEREQAILDQHDDDTTALSVRLQKFVTKTKPVTPGCPTSNRKTSLRKLLRLERNLKSTEEALSTLPENHDDVTLLDQHHERLDDYKRELSVVYDNLLALDLEDGDELILSHERLEKLLFECSHILRKSLNTFASTSATAPVTGSRGVKLPKIDVPTFNGSILNWRTFWEQFSVAVHTHSSISDAEKLVYLRHSVKDGSAKSVIEGLSRTGDQYNEAIDCLKTRYDRPRLIHQAHVKKILEVPSLKLGNGKELRYLHDTVQQHLRALKAMGYEPSGPFITSVLELKLDAGTMFEWQKHSHDTTDVRTTLSRSVRFCQPTSSGFGEFRSREYEEDYFR